LAATFPGVPARADQAAFQSVPHHAVGQKDDSTDHQIRQVHRGRLGAANTAGHLVPDLAVADAWADRDGDHSGDCPAERWATVRDFP